ncbi:hypothetical protein ACFYY2_07615 [Streptomyces sp. NPDC001822]|uniref:hypothetical protein n=1 Tax=Streptomyces sp. NPDC001822 TaxID=3364614 RepID=UPI0036BFCCE3
MTHTEAVTLSDGATVRVRIERGPMGDAMLHEQNSNNWRGGGRIYWRGRRLHLMFGDDSMPMQNPRFEFADDVDEAAEMALAFFVECAESCVTHAKGEGIPVQSCYTT